MTEELSFLHRYIRIKTDDGYIDIIAMNNKTKEFIEKAKNIHGDKYNY